jgi:hypothetical protein
MVPWGADFTLVLRASFHDGAPEHVLFNGCVADPICASLYADALVAVTATAKRLRLGARARAIHRGLRSRIAADPRLEHTVPDSRAALQSTVGFTIRRRADVRTWTSHLPRGPRSIAVSGGAETIEVRWAKPFRRSAITGYAVEYRGTDGVWVRVPTAPSTTAVAIAGLAPGTYEVRVRTVAGSAASAPAPTRVVSVGL